MAKCVLIIQLENPQIAHNSLVQLFGIHIWEKNSHHMFIFHVHDVGQQVPREMQKMGCISIVSSFVYMVYCNTAGKQKRIMFRKLSSPFFCSFCSFNKITQGYLLTKSYLKLSCFFLSFSQFQQNNTRILTY